VRAVLLDALGTLVGLEPPVPHLLQALAARGVQVDPQAAGAAVRAEMALYRAEHHRAGTAQGLTEVRAQCAAALREALGAPAAGLDAEQMGAVLLESFRFFAYPEVPAVLEELRARGITLVVCSNWDLSLHDVLARTGLDARLDGAAVSAVEGVAKPATGLFARALARAGDVPPAAALHVGDSVAHDVAGALAAGLRPVLVARDGDEVRSHDEGGAAPDGVPVVRDLRALPGLV
jgi:putative hydrolase of the HAD superfamily